MTFRVSNLDYIVFGNERDSIVYGTSTGEAIFAYGGDDVVWGNGGDDQIQGGDGEDQLIGGVGNDQLFGGNDNDRLWGEDDNDELFGGDGNDYLDGGAGQDELTGGLGADTFAFGMESVPPPVIEPHSTVANPDYIKDFNRIEGDKIDLESISFYNNVLLLNSVLHLIGDSAFSGSEGELRYEIHDVKPGYHYTSILGDMDGDGQADFQINVAGKIDFIASDFVL
jgi:Ca2+-binding RTX toxin-like protein